MKHIQTFESFLNEANEIKVMHFVGIMPNGNYMASHAEDEESMIKQLKTTGITDNYKVVGTSGSFQTDKTNFNKMNNLAHKIGKEGQKTGKLN